MRDRIYVHIAWTTRDRERTIDRGVAEFLAEALPIIARQERAVVLEIGIVRTHLHLLVRLHPTTAIPRLMQRMKGGTSIVANRDGIPSRVLRWAKGYNIDSVNSKGLETVGLYIRNQALRHPRDMIPDWSPPPIASATSAEPRL